jgi:hypothetical protein
MPHVFLDPDGTQELGLVVIVEARTGVTYGQQCGGNATKQRTTEGFLIPVGSPSEARKVYDWFWATFKGTCYASPGRDLWTPETIAQLQLLVGQIPCWYSTRDGKDELHHLKLDTERMDDCIEAWIPVLTPYGSGILTLNNSD